MVGGKKKEKPFNIFFFPYKESVKHFPKFEYGKV